MNQISQRLVNCGFAYQSTIYNNNPLSHHLHIIEKPIPCLKKGEVLIKVLASPINPSDLVFLMDQYGIPPVEGNYAGFEGCGIVINANAGLYGKWLTGKRVAIFATPKRDGIWAKYAITKLQYCIPVRKQLTDEQAATLVVNPFTSLCLVDRVKTLNAQGIVINAAASQVGKACILYAKLLGIKTIAIVRSQASFDTLQKNHKPDCLLLTTDDSYLNELKHSTHKFNASVLLDAVTEKTTPQILKQMPNNSTAIVYGRLAEIKNSLGGYFNVADVIFRNIKIEGFWLSHYVKTQHPLKIYYQTQKVQKLFAEGIFNTDIQAVVGFEEFADRLDFYAQNKSLGKVIFKPNATQAK